MEIDAKLTKYFEVTTKAYDMAKEAPKNDEKQAMIILDMVSRYISDAHHFEEQGEKLLAFAALNYAHGWLDCGAVMKVYEVKDSTLFTVDDES
jgi:hypothetical protein